VTPFPTSLPQYQPQVHRLIMRSMLMDNTLTLGDFKARQRAWAGDLAGQQWKLETGATPSPAGTGQPFYPSLVNIPALINISSERGRIRAEWNTLRGEIEGRLGQGTPAATKELTACGPHNQRVTKLGLISSIQPAIEMTSMWPRLETSKVRLATSLNVLAKVQPVAELLFRTMRSLGWQDLIFQTQGAFCFRGIKNGTAAAARNLSDHGLGIAFDLNVFENPQLRTGVPVVPGTMDPRIVALFNAFHFQWGKCFRPSDLHHFDYIG
jgi:hypothetical protein